MCALAAGYLPTDSFKFYKADALFDRQRFTTRRGWKVDHNPSVFMSKSDPVHDLDHLVDQALQDGGVIQSEDLFGFTPGASNATASADEATSTLPGLTPEEDNQDSIIDDAVSAAVDEALDDFEGLTPTDEEDGSLTEREETLRARKTAVHTVAVHGHVDVACTCDPAVEFSHYTTCSLRLGHHGKQTVHVLHSAHKKCHPLDDDYLTCREASKTDGAQHKCQYFKEDPNFYSEVLSVSGRASFSTCKCCDCGATCTAGTIRHADTNSCSFCRAGTFSDADDTTECKKCPADTFNAVTPFSLSDTANAYTAGMRTKLSLADPQHRWPAAPGFQRTADGDPHFGSLFGDTQHYGHGWSTDMMRDNFALKHAFTKCDACATGQWTNGLEGQTECVADPAYAAPTDAPTAAPTAAAQVKHCFGLYDSELAPPVTPGAAWELMTAADFEVFETEAAFIDQYNDLGIKVLAPFTSGNCCISVKGGNMLTITGTPYGFQSPADMSNGINCNPEAGYSGHVRFFKAPVLEARQRFSSRRGCRIGHNPAVYMKVIPEDEQCD